MQQFIKKILLYRYRWLARQAPESKESLEHYRNLVHNIEQEIADAVAEQQEIAEYWRQSYAQDIAVAVKEADDEEAI